ncbi:MULTISPECIES: alpha/beta hydrolase [unclassified Leptolyngbya]|uniref:alpha/beta fold hydrolase n=1 Tax=unclassified Leptolyngbya TaxID=2650499 RepID=UPI0016897E61|nr:MULTISPECIES: alpha/beta hydrolase [unclassified Leptolyngbya]MBD1909395.1 alpha/beta hydrolase [Leptolyngbya sp. FACHB-8]MBD2157112.1 alpha/beta hydrolase [Leptolyngbya sp. FACHB-16]
MFSDFLPSSVADIRDAEAIALLQQMKRQMLPVFFVSGKTAVTTAYVHYHPQAPSVPSTSPILLLHGFDSSLLEFRRLLPLLGSRSEVWAVDLFGSGFTEYISTTSVNPQTIRQHLLGVLETWIKEPIVLVGASLGGAVAIDFTLHHPNWVRSLALIDSVGFSGSFPAGKFLPDPLIELGADWLYFRKRAALTAASALPLVDTALVDALRCSLVHQEMPGWKDAIASFTRSGGYADLSDRITEIQHPTLILWGAQDDVLGTADANRFKQVISGSQLIWIQQAGHVPHYDQPKTVANHLLAFAQEPIKNPDTEQRF